MTRITVELPEELARKVERRAREAGHRSTSDYVQSVLRDDADQAEDADPGAPNAVKVRTAEELNALIESRLDDARGSIEATPDFFDGLRQRARDVAARKGRP